MDTGASFSRVMRKRAWTAEPEILVLDGEKAVHTKEADEAVKEAGFTRGEQLPPNSPDFNPIENAWAVLNDRLGETDPGTLEKWDSFKIRVANAMRRVNENKAEQMENMVRSMPRRLAECLTLKGARTGY